MDIVERLRICAKNDPHDTKDNIFANAADEIERLRQQVEQLRTELRLSIFSDTEYCKAIVEDNERLHQQNAELVEALENAANGYRDRGHEGLEDMCRAAIAKATGGE